jgi:hypothetical protein
LVSVVDTIGNIVTLGSVAIKSNVIRKSNIKLTIRERGKTCKIGTSRKGVTPERKRNGRGLADNENKYRNKATKIVIREREGKQEK